MFLKRGWLILALMSVLSAAAWAQKPDEDEKAKLASFVSKLFNVERSTIMVSDVKPSALIQGGREATITVGANSVTVYMVGDKLIIGNAYDKDYDPLKALMAKMTLKGRPTKGRGPVVIAEFSEFQCPYCSRASETLKQVLKEYDGKISIVFKHYPLEMHNWAMKAALATEAVFQMKPALFWDLHDQIFSAQKEINAENFDTEVENFIKANKLDLAEYKKKLASDSVKKAVEQDMQDVKNVGLRTGTPSFYIDGRFIGGAQPIEAFRKVIDDAIGGVPASKAGSKSR